MSLDRPSASPPEPAAPWAAWELAPAALLQLDHRDALLHANAAARALFAGVAADTLAQWLVNDPVLRRTLAESPTPQDLPLPRATPEAPTGWVRAQAQALPMGGWVLSLQLITDMRQAQSETSHLHELLDLARDFGRMGLWERDARTLEGRWDRQVFRFRGLPVADVTPSFEQSLENVAEVDREALDTAFRQSLRCAGRYSHRYRLRGPNGRLRPVHSHWIVKNGPDGVPERALGLLLDDAEPFALVHGSDEIESQLALAVDLGRIAVWRHDLATQRMHYNAQAWAVLDMSPRPEGMSLEEARALIHPEDLPQMLASAREALGSDQPTDMEARYRRADGSWRDVLTRRVVQRDAAGQPIAFLGVAMDLTERIEQNRRAHELSRRFELVTRSAGIGHWSQHGLDGRAIWSSQLRALCDLKAHDPAPTGREWLEHWVHPSDRVRVRKSWIEWLRSGRPALEATYRIISANGTLRQIISHTRNESTQREPLIFGVVIDITERLSAEQAMRTAAERSALAARGAGLATWEQDLRDGSAFWDEQMWILRGLTPADKAPDALGRLACVHPDDRALVALINDRALAESGPIDFEFRILKPDGQLRWLASRSGVVNDDHGQPLRRIGVNWDVTDSRTAEAVRQQREIAQRESAAKSRFLARMSHELRTPLNAVLGFTQLLLNEESDAAAPVTAPALAARRRRLDHIQSAGQHLLTLINDVLDLASLESGEIRIALQPVALEPLVVGTLPMLGPLLLARQVSVRCGPLGARVMADATRLRQVLLNLLSNGVKYNRAGGEVWVEAESSDDGTQVLLRVSDTGNGMNDEQLRHLFEPFNRLGAQHDGIEGSGIGLAIVKTLVERMGGTVQVRSKPGVGSVFELRLAAPATTADTRDTHDARVPDALPRTRPATSDMRRRHILYIEDNPVNALIIGELLGRRADLTLHIAVDGQDGVSKARTLLPDLVLLDMQLPDIDGLEVMRRLRAEPATAGIACIALSANAMPEDIEQALQAGVADYWTKPLDFKAFMASLDALFGTAA